MAAPTEILSLVERFNRSREAYLSGEYNETQLRREFLDPFFKALGWDVENTQGHAEPYKDVVHEDAIKIGTVTKAPDYSFRIGGVRKFFVEAKKPSVNVKEDISPAYQLRRYAWSAKLPLSILTDFEEFAVYDCRVRPLPTDKSSTNRTMYLRCTDYETKWDEIADVFSKDAVLKGSFDKYAETNKRKRGTAEVDDAFLHEIEEWRTALASNIALRNAELSQRELNFAVQRTIDRIIFLRICEDRGIETYGALMSLQNGERIYKRLVETFHRADERYNSGLFHFRPEKERNEPPDEMTLGLDIDDKPLKEIIKSLYYPHSPYEFSVLPADILGQVYEQFLGKVIRLTAGHHAVVEDKPEVKKAGGVYYTPTYIVDYIVKNTVGRLLGSDPTPSPTDLTPALSKGEGVLREAPNPRFMTTDAGTWKYLKPLAQENRQQATEAEEKLWQPLRNRQLGFKFRRQHAIDQFIVDFVCIERNLVVEVDGQVHADQQEYDAERSRMLNTRGFQVIRFWNHEVINNIEDVLARIHQALDLTPAPSPNWRGVSEGRGEVRKQMTPKHVSKLRILDPACGSGSFLIGAYQYLLDWHRDGYINNDREKWTKGKNPTLYQAQGGEWRLTTTERKRILLNSIYGVDIDAQAVETTKLSLLLKVLEGENEQTISRQFKMFHERALPDLGSNIKCGNSLIGPDFYDGQLSLMDDNERMRINVFDWKKEFKEIMDVGGFDAVIGNPPYIRIQGFNADQIEYFKVKFESAKGNADIYVSFIEGGYRLLSGRGILGMIVPNKFFKTDYGEALRSLLTRNQSIRRVVDFGAEQVFDATTYTCLLFLSKVGTDTFYYGKAQPNAYSLSDIEFVEKRADSAGKDVWLFGDEATGAVRLKLLENTKRLLDLPVEMSRGSSTGNDDIFMLSSNEAVVEKSILRDPVFATDFSRYSFAPSGKWKIIFPYRINSESYEAFSEEELRSKFPKAYKYLQSHSAELKKRKQFKDWFGFSAPRNLHLHDGAHIMVPLLANKGMFALIPESSRGDLCPMAGGGFSITLLPGCTLDPRYVLGLLNSRLVFWKLQDMSNVFRGGWITCTKQYFGELPVRTINFSDPADKSRHDKMVGLVEQMLDLNKKFAAANTAHEKTALQRQINATDKQIDELVYELYGLSEEERKIVEGL